MLVFVGGSASTPEKTSASGLPPGRLFAISPSNDIEKLISIDPVTGDVADVVSLTGYQGNSSALAFSPGGRLIGNTAEQGLYEVDTETGVLTLLGPDGWIQAPGYPSTQVNALAFDQSGTLYATDRPNDLLLSLDPDAQTVTVIGALGVDIEHNGLAIDFWSDQLYMIEGGLDGEDDNLYLVDKGTGAATLVGSLGMDVYYVGAEFEALSGKLYAVRDSNQLFEIDVSTGAATHVATLAVTFLNNLAAPWLPVVDSDRDGCTDYAELQTDPGSEALGGQRNAKYFWDFYDVWTHPIGQPTVWVRDRFINLPGEILGIAARFGPGPPPPPKDQAVAAALTPPLDENGYHIAYDRGIVVGANLWDKAPPDGWINIPDDILGVTAQFGHRCDGPIP